MGLNKTAQRQRPANTPLGGLSIYPAWRLPTNPVFIPLSGCPQTQWLFRLAVSTSTMTLRRKENVETLPVTSQKTRSPWLSRLTAAREASVRPAWRAPNPEPCTERIPSPACGGRGSHEKNAHIFFMGTREGGRRPEGGNTNPMFTPLDGHPQTQHLSRLAATHKPSVYPAWRLLTNPAFTPLGSHPRTQPLSRLAATHKPSIYPAWRPPANPAFIPLGSYPQTQHLSRLAATRKPSVYPAWQPPTNPAFIVNKFYFLYKS